MANIHPVKFGKRERMTFSRIKDVLDIPNLIEVQKNSYETFMREGIAEVFKDFLRFRITADISSCILWSILSTKNLSIPKRSAEKGTQLTPAL